MPTINVPNDHKHRLGRIRVADMEAILGIVPSMFGQLAFIPIAVSLWENSYQLVYTGYSTWFDELMEGDTIPEYVVEMEGTGSSFVVETVNRITL